MNQPVESREPLKVAVLSSAAGGGAGIAARRVTDALNLSDDISADFIDMVALGGRMPDDAAPPGNMSNRRMTDTHFTVEFPGYVRGWVVDLLRQYDVLNIHWASFLLGLGELDELSRLGMPILFTCHDYYYFTGGCHYPANCENLSKGCNACPQVNQNVCSTLVIAQNQKIKKRILARPNVHLSAPSAFLVNEAVNAGMISADDTHVLRNPYSPVPGVVRTRCAGPPKIVLIADSLTERRKAMPLAIASLGLAFRKLQGKNNGVIPFVVEIIGDADGTFKREVDAAGFSHCFHGKITEHSDVARLLAVCDVLLTCSYEDNWPNVLVEAGAYGAIPVVGPGHGCEEFVREFGIGEVASEYAPSAFSEAVIAAVHDRKLNSTDQLRCQVIETHSPDMVNADYRVAMSKILNESGCVTAPKQALQDTLALRLDQLSIS
jgi:glycosyltransferase involved in cell wall biosynthesis